MSTRTVYEFLIDYMDSDLKASCTQKDVTVLDEQNRVLLVYPLVLNEVEPYISKGLWIESKTVRNETVLDLMMHSNEVGEDVAIFEVHITEVKKEEKE